MSDGIWSALSGAVGQLAVLDAAANNVANASNPGFRGDQTIFREVLSRAATPRPNAAAQRGQFKNIRYATVDSVSTDTTQGALVQTARPLDVAIRGDGFFTVRTPNGDRFTRVGSVQIAADGRLTTKEGHPYIGVDKLPLRVPPTSIDAQIGPDGAVRAGRATLGQMMVVRFSQPGALQKQDSSLFQPSAASGAPTAIPADLAPATLEQSNVSAVKGMVDIVGATRAFEACERCIEAFRDADRRAAMALMGNG